MVHDTDTYPGLSSSRSNRRDDETDSDPSDDLPGPDGPAVPPSEDGQGSPPACSATTEEGYARIGKHAFDAESLKIYRQSDVSDYDGGYVAIADHAADTSPWRLGRDSSFDDEFLRTHDADDVGWFFDNQDHTPEPTIPEWALDEYLVEFETSDRDDGDGGDYVRIGPHEWDAETLVIVDKQDVGVTSHGYLAVAEHTRDSEPWKIGPDEMLDASFRATRRPDDDAWFYGPGDIPDDVVEEYLIEPFW